MKLVRFDAADPITRFDSRGATIGGIARCRGEVRLSLAVLGPGGAIGLHEAASPQLLLVVEGAGRVRGADGEPAEVQAGGGVLWEAGEQHETTTERGLRAVVVEADSLELL